MRKGAVPALPLIEQPEELRREDLSRLAGDKGTINLPQKLRDSHHRIARLAATGMKNNEIAQRTGYTQTRISSLINSPAMQELIATYRARVDEAFIASVDEYYDLATSNMLAAERHIADHIAELDETGELLPVNTALRISRDAADRFGYSKHTTSTNVNVDFAKSLEKAITAQRSRVIDAEATAVPPSASAGAVPTPREAAPALIPRQNPSPALVTVGEAGAASSPAFLRPFAGPVRRRA